MITLHLEYDNWVVGIEERTINHLAIIPDGNRRWAEQHNISKQEGYAIGIKKIGDVLKWCKEADIRMLTMWGFSLENFNRDRKEIGGLFELFKKNLIEGLGKDDENKKELKVKFLGRTNLFPKEIQELISKAEKRLSGEKKYQLNLLLSYAGRAEIIDAVNSIIKSGVKEVNEETFPKYLYTKDIPDPELIIRTSGERRLSGLLPWQSTYSELYFCEKLWPDFSKEDFTTAVDDYKHRKRRFGK